MLPADIDIINRDPNLPGLSLLFNPEGLLEKLRQHLTNFNLGIPQSYYLRYKPHTNCLVAYQLPVNNQLVTIYAKAYHQDDQEKFHKWQNKQSIAGILDVGRIALSESMTIISEIPNDSKVKGLSHIANPTKQKLILNKLFPEQPQLCSGEIKGLRYKPERRYVAQSLLLDKPQGLIKAYTTSAYKNISLKIDNFSSQGNLRLSKVIKKNSQHQMISFEWLQGDLLTDVMLSSDWQDSIMTNVGAALGEFHRQNICQNLTATTPNKEVKTIQSLAKWISFIAPVCHNIVNQIARKLGEKLFSLSHIDYCNIHGDFYADQVLLMEANQIGILDLDRCVIGNPASDIGNFIAHLARQVLFGQFTSDCVDRIKEHFLLGYEAISPYSIRSQVNLYKAICLFRLLGEPFRSRNPDWLEKMQLILEHIQGILPDSD
jgi:tRNA A-37 threonylcarbamoyl transferase component Bud32